MRLPSSCSFPSSILLVLPTLQLITLLSSLRARPLVVRLYPSPNQGQDIRHWQKDIGRSIFRAVSATTPANTCPLAERENTGELAV
jgi:hypothetical protein